MPLMDHLRELRSRLFKSVLAIGIGAVVAWFFYDPPGDYRGIIDLIIDPFCKATEDLRAQQGLEGCNLVLDSVIAPFMLQLQVSVVVGMLLTSPFWLYQLWRFITPGLHKNERRWTLVFLGTSVPLFLAGAALAFFVLPKGVAILLQFTPDNVINLIKVDEYLRFMIRTMLVFGIGFLLPVVIVVLNLIGILSAEKLRKTRNWTVVGIFIFAAVGTPTGDPLTMLLVALPMWGLYEASVIIARIHDRRRRLAGDEIDYDALSDDEASSITPASDVEAPSEIDDPDETPPPDNDDRDES